MKKNYMLLLTLTVSTLWIHVPDRGIHTFPFNPNVTLSHNQYFWFICQNLIFITLASIIWDETTEYKNIALIYLIIIIADLVTFMLWYDDPLKHFIINWNIIKTVVFMSVIFYEVWKRKI